MTEKCNNIEGFTIQCGMGGGTGTGLTHRLLEAINIKYPKRITQVHGIYPTPLLSKMIAEPYNVVLGTHALMEKADIVIVFDNEAIYDINQRLLGVSLPRYIHIDRLIAYALMGITAPLRYSIGEVNHSLTQIHHNLVPLPRFHFLTPGCAPIGIHHGSLGCSWLEAFRPCNLFVKSDCSFSCMENTYLAVSLNVQGVNVKEKYIDSSIDCLGLLKIHKIS